MRKAPPRRRPHPHPRLDNAAGSDGYAEEDAPVFGVGAGTYSCEGRSSIVGKEIGGGGGSGASELKGGMEDVHALSAFMTGVLGQTIMYSGQSEEMLVK